MHVVGETGYFEQVGAREIGEDFSGNFERQLLENGHRGRQMLTVEEGLSKLGGAGERICR